MIRGIGHPTRPVGRAKLNSTYIRSRSVYGPAYAPPYIHGPQADAKATQKQHPSQGCLRYNGPPLR